MKPRRKAREVAFQTLYRFDIDYLQAKGPLPETRLLAEETQKHFDHFGIPSESREFANQLVSGTLKDLSKIDETIQAHAAHWRLERVSHVDRNLLRIASYEIMEFPDIHPSVTIDEAVELAKQFGTEKSASFVNGILDAIAEHFGKN
jgi:transcription antitermination protein NusB